MIKRILYPTDFSEHADKCLNFILKMQPCGVEEVVLLHVLDERFIKYTDEMFDSTIDDEQIIDECREDCQKKFTKLVKKLQTHGIKTKVMMRYGVPFSVILKTADQVHASLIVMGHKGHNLAEELLIGSVAEKVVRKCKRPVLLVR